MHVSYRSEFHCRFCRSSQARAGSRSAFAIPGSRKHYAPDLLFKLEHLALDAKVDPEAGTLQATTRQRFRVVASDRNWIDLDQQGLTIRAARVGGVASDFQVESGRVRLPLKTAPAAGSKIEIELDYEVRKPRRGIYFTGPDRDYPKKPYQVWTQGQDEDTRYWIPTHDYPNQKATSEVSAWVPQGYTAVSNGALIAQKQENGGTRFHYRLGVPHVTYLISLVVAKFSEWKDTGPNGLPIPYYVAPGREPDGKRAFGNTPQMIALFEEKTGVRFPFEKYSQVAVQDFIFGGMENSSATTQTDRILHDERATLDFSADYLVSHELAHQWFGDLVTCRDWSQGWLNEGFATFMERVWVESHQGVEEARYYSLSDLREYLEEDSQLYRRPIVCSTYVEPIDLFDRHLYQKGGLVLNLLRAQLGERAFWDSVKTYLNRHREGSVETLDLIRAIEDTTGKNLRKFFDQWVFGAGHPELELSYAWHEETKRVELVVEQKQTGGHPTLEADGSVTHLFEAEVPVRIVFADGSERVTSVRIASLKDRFIFDCPSKPRWIRFDAHGDLPKTMKFPRPKELLVEQLRADPDCTGRIEAAHELVAGADLETVRVLSERLLSDPFWGVQAEIAECLAKLPFDEARDALRAGLQVKHPKARRAVVKALGKLKDPKDATSLLALADRDPSLLVEAEATLAYAKTMGSVDPSAVEALIARQLKKESHLDAIRSAAILALNELKGIELMERPQSLELAIAWAQPGGDPVRNEDVRAAALQCLASIARRGAREVRGRVSEVFARVTEEDRFRLRMRMIPAIQESELSESASWLKKIHSTDADGRIKRLAHSALSAIRSGGEIPNSVRELKDSIEKLEAENRKLFAKLEELTLKDRPKSQL